MTDDEVAAYHEAAHVVIAASGNWTRLVEPVVLLGRGYGNAAVSMDREKIKAAITASDDFDVDAPRNEFVCAFLAGAAVERVLVARLEAQLSESDILSAAAGDYRLARDQLAKMDPPQLEHLASYESSVREVIERPVVWCMIEKVAMLLLEHRTLAHDAVPAILDEIGEVCVGEHTREPQN